MSAVSPERGDSRPHGRADRAMLLPAALLLGLALALWAHSEPAREAPATSLDLAVLEDPGGRLSFDEVRAAPPEAFTPLPKATLARGYTRSVHWLRLTVDTPPGAWWLRILPPYLDDLRFYQPDPARPEGFLEQRSGDRLPFSARAQPYRGFVFELLESGQGARTCYLRLQTTSTSMMLLDLLSPGQLHRADVTEHAVFIGCIAVLLVLLLVNLHALADPGSRLVAWFFATVASLVLLVASLSGFLAQYLFARHPALNNVVVGLSALLFLSVSHGLHRELCRPAAERGFVGLWLRLGFWLPLLLGFSVFTPYYPIIVSPLVTLTLISVGLVCVLLWRDRRSRTGGNPLLLLGAVVYLAGLVANGLCVQGVDLGRFAQLYSMPVAALGSLFLMHFAMLARSRGLQAERQRAMEASLAEKALRERQSGFFAMLSHELKTPLAVIDSAAQLLQEAGPAAPEAGPRLARIRNAVQRIDRVVQSALQHDRLIYETREPRQTVELSDLMGEVVAGFRDSTGRLRVLACEPVRLLGDPVLLRLMLGNLIENAIKYAPGETPIEVSLRSGSGKAVLEVRDHGPGIAEVDRPRLFERYVRGSGIGDIPGTGLGLHAVAEVARQHGGRVELLEPEAGVGALFRVTLPLDEASTTP